MAEVLNKPQGNKSANGTTVTVCCKLPNGMRLRVYGFGERHEPVLGGGTRAVRQAFPMGDEVVIAGWSHPQNRAPENQIVAGYAVTHGVDAQFWEQWLEQNKDAEFVTKGLIFAHAQAQSAIDKAKDGAKIKSGLERLDPSKMPGKLEVAKA